jgi:general secretion pathway protein M
MLLALQAWKRLSLRERYLLQGLAVFLLAGLAFQVLWQPTQQRLADAARQYQQQRALAQQVHSAQPSQALVTSAQSLSSRISERAMAVGLDLQQIEVQSDQLRLTIGGEAQTLLNWLVDLERDAGTFQVLTLEKRGTLLEVRLVL